MVFIITIKYPTLFNRIDFLYIFIMINNTKTKNFKFMVHTILILCWIFIIFSGCIRGCYYRVIQHKTSLATETTPTWWPFKERKLSLLATITENISILVAIAAIIVGIVFREIQWLIIGFFITMVLRFIAQYSSMLVISCIAKKHAAKMGITLVKECF